LSNVLSMKKKTRYLIVRRASLHGNLLSRQPDLVVPGKRTVLSVEPCIGQLEQVYISLQVLESFLL
jgi:hypothetical protein